MAGYTITITPNDDEAGACTTIRVDTTSGSARITELTVRAAEGGSIFPQQIPALNLDQLIAALVPSATAAIPATPSSSEQAPAEHAPLPADVSAVARISPDSSSVESSSQGSSSAESSSPESASPSPARAGRQSRAKKATRTSPAKKASSGSRQTKGERTATAAQSTSGRRAYRRMPEPGEVLAAYREVGGTTALARHYGVPRHTATGWLRRLRSQGMLD